MPNKLRAKVPYEEYMKLHAKELTRERAACAKPLLPEEYAAAEALGSFMRDLRYEAGLSVSRAALASDMSTDGWYRIERATRRTRPSTLLRIANGMAKSLGRDAAELYAELVRRAGNAIAAESLYWERVERRRAKRLRVNAARAARQQAQAENWREVRDSIKAYEKRLWS